MKPGSSASRLLYWSQNIKSEIEYRNSKQTRMQISNLKNQNEHVKWIMSESNHFALLTIILTFDF